MTNIKKYRATTTREALEMIKRDLGEDAFVLETKRVKTGGFMGIRSKLQVEVSAAAPAMFGRSNADPAAPAKKTKGKGIPSHGILNLGDDGGTYSRPAVRTTDQKKENLISALSARASASNDFEREMYARSKAFSDGSFEPVEISPEAPRVVFPKREAPKQEVESGPVKRDTVAALAPNRELELLRAELREVKFSLSAYANLQPSNSWNSDIDLDIFGGVFDAPFHGIFSDLTGVGVPGDMARKFISDIVPLHKANPVAASHLTRATLLRALTTNLKFEQDALQREVPVVMALIGPTGVGKTTTIAKLAARVSLHEHRRVELVTLDTYRIAAVEQLKTYAEIIGAGCHVVRSVLELDAVLKRLPSDATVLIDTTGRSPHDLADQYELSDFLQKNLAIRKCLAVQATTHPVDSLAAIKKFEMYGADCLAVTKIDETMRPGAVLETIVHSGLPLAYFCTGQRVPEDLQIATAASLTDRILGKKS
ncbi:MAG TPA: flagellar biosynthesis protein FlhF [Pyrinomonadaceae bacterium]|nr:flagellar biosynthesis protein FlhF [Pyrinomonadaceae bacterium]